MSLFAKYFVKLIVFIAIDYLYFIYDIKTMTDFLFARPSLLEGIGRNIDLFGIMNSYNNSRSGQEADKKAFYNDWLSVYKDLNKAYNQTLCQIEAKKPTKI